MIEEVPCCLCGPSSRMSVCTALTILYYPVIDYLKGMKGAASKKRNLGDVLFKTASSEKTASFRIR